MVTNFIKLLKLCDDELRQREYTGSHYKILSKGWSELFEWMRQHNYIDFNKEIAYAYCDEVLGGHLIKEGMSSSVRYKLRSVRMLLSYQKDGDFEYRTPEVEHDFNDPVGIMVLEYIKLCENVLQLSAKTIEAKELYLYEFKQYLKMKQYSINDLNTDVIENFFKYKEYTLASRHNASRNIRLFLRFAFDSGITEKDQSIYVLKDNYRKQSKLPTTYTELEIQKIIATVERTSAVGKRDYLVLLLAAEYGWRSGDITHLCFKDIDWDKNVIRFNQHKTGNPVEFPLLASVGNAIIDYIKNGRPVTDVPEIIVAADSSKRGKPLTSPTIHSIVTKYMRKANIKNWETKKHGAHSLRHSLATNMLKKNISMPIISTVMGHQSTASTKVYLSVDIEKLRQCVLPMPPILSDYYRREAE
ncbi:MAG: tyrosine-type recombinase/integrase [Clostridia bacterium]|nr:tyrosine-type recombinase/integrase [Clostridia bacterium]